MRDFAAGGRLTLAALGRVAGVTPSFHILDVGCGIGRLAVAMPGFLDADGGYEGFDIVPEGIEWCQQHIVSPHDNVRFTLADVYNKEYNPKGRVQPADYRFPYQDETFDAAVLISVFTHMLPRDVDRYVGEIARDAQEEREDLRHLLRHHAGIAPADELRRWIGALQAQPRAVLDSKREGPRARRRL